MKPPIRFGILFVTLALLSACGGGGGVDSGGIGGTGIVSTGVMTKGSVVLNGVKFDDSTANISIDDTPKTAADLRDGMVVQLLGRVGADGVPITGTAVRVEAQIEVRGAVTSAHPTENPQRFVVLGQNVIVDDLTIYSNLANFAAITATTLVEVHGLRDTTGRIRATRVEANAAQMGDSTVDEIRGVVSGGAAGPNPLTFNLGTQAVNAAGAVIAPVGATYANDSVVEVHCNNVRPCVVAGVFQASRVEVESAEDSIFQPGNNGRFEAEGLISGFGGHPGSFFVAGIPVTTTNSTRFEGGISDDLGNDIKVEAEGIWNGSALIANKIEFKRTVVRLQGDPGVPAGNTFTLQIANIGPVTIEADDLTELTDGTLPAGTETCIQIRGQRKVVAGQVVTAGEIRLSCSSSDRHFIQAPIEVEAGTSLTLIGFPINVGAPTDGYRDVNDNAISQSQFFNQVSPSTTNSVGVSIPGTLVKISFNNGTNTVREAEIED
jgi:hypothetical protein